MKNWYLYALVFISGAAVLAVEILGTRILGPFYGVSLFLWSALITVTLAALSVGYAIGGRWADRGPRLARLCYLLAVAGIWLLFIPIVRRPVLFIAEPFGLRFAVLLATFILFAPPLTLLGMVSPYAIRLKALDLSEVGRTAGDLYAISTIGSVLAALATGFVLIPSVGVNRLTFLIGAVLIVTAVLGLLKDRAWKTAAAAVLVLLVAVPVALANSAGERADPESGLLAVEQSPYAEIRVLDIDGVRHLLIDGGIHTLVNRLTWTSYFPYVAVTELAREYFERPGRMLLLGLGGGTIAKNYSRAGWAVDAVEIDPVVVDLAREYFGFTASDANVYEIDGREFLIRSNEIYDVIIVDAFGSSSIPFHLITRESFGLVADHLQADGVLMVNVESLGWEDRTIKSVTATLLEHFSHVLALPTTAVPDEFGNVIVLASNRVLEVPADLQDMTRTRGHWLNNNYLRRAWDKRFIPDPRQGFVLTDDLNPIDVWSEEVNFVARKDLHDYFGANGRSW
ncbi:MAG: fused MFS/spermidine synthase [Gemmatimonadota bacterium]|nr:MAG: fused MFS/spermidine synthase [Gemmatimonadota bacterium]